MRGRIVGGVGAILLAALTSPTLAVVWNVNPEGTGDAATIQEAFDLASPGDIVLLAPGVYTDSHTRTIQGHSQQQTTTAVAFMSPGVSITSSGGADVTTIDGQGDRHCLFGTDTGVVTISGITFFDGSRAGGEIWGGGLMLHRSDPIVEECTFVDCDALNGAAIFVSQGTDAFIRFNKFLDNTAEGFGGAIEIFEHHVAAVENNTFVRNAALRGGAILMNSSSVHLSNNIYAWNTAGSRGGALACINNLVVTGTCELFWENTAPVDPHVTACTVVIGQNENLLADPLFCDPDLDDFNLMVGSPAAPDHPSGCGLRGACPVGCGPIRVEPTSFGRVKSAYR